MIKNLKPPVLLPPRQKMLDLPPSERQLKKAWNHAISRVDKHALKCRRCGKRVITEQEMKASSVLMTKEPYRLCRKALSLYKEERGAMEAYRKAMGRLALVTGRPSTKGGANHD